MSGREENSLGGRVRRYAQVTSTVGGLAARLAGSRYLGVKLDRERHAADLREALGGIRGPLMKVAQILATVPDALPDAYARELQELQANAPDMGWPFVRRRMTSELGAGWRARFVDFEKSAAAAASLGQVHRARVEVAGNGSDRTRPVACKLQYPDMRAAVEADLGQLALALKVYRQYDEAIDTSDIYVELSDRLREELDYSLEARHMKLYATMLGDEAAVHVPEVVDELSTDRLLTMTWLDGAPLTSICERDTAFRNQVALNMFRAWYVPFYGYGIIHGDPHLGNYTVREDAGVNLLDYGCVRVFPPPFVRGVIDLYRALRDNDRDLAVHAYETWGFGDLGQETIDVLNLWAEFLYAPLMEDKPRRIQESDSGLYGARVVNQVHRELKRLGGVRPPREFVFMDRAAIGLGSVFLRLKAEINWHELFHSLIDGFDEAALAKRQAAALKAAGLEPRD